MGVLRVLGIWGGCACKGAGHAMGHVGAGHNMGAVHKVGAVHAVGLWVLCMWVLCVWVLWMWVLCLQRGCAYCGACGCRAQRGCCACNGAVGAVDVGAVPAVGLCMLRGPCLQWVLCP